MFTGNMLFSSVAEVQFACHETLPKLFFIFQVNGFVNKYGHWFLDPSKLFIDPNK
jgi:hypothetical protein